MFVISEVCCNFCDWWRMENQKLHKQPCWISLIIDGINIQNLGRWPPNDYLGPNSVSFHPVVQKIYNNFLCLINLADSEDDWNVIKLWLNHIWQFVIGEVSCNVCDWWSLLWCLWLVKSFAMFVKYVAMFEIVEAVTVLAIGEVYWSIAMFFIGELCCNVCDWWRMENQKLNKKPCCLYCIIDGVNIQNLRTGLSKVRDHFRPNLVSLYPMVQMIFKDFQFCNTNQKPWQQYWMYGKVTGHYYTVSVIQGVL